MENLSVIAGLSTGAALPREGGIAQALTQRIRDAVARGELVVGDRIPASRVIAGELGIARGTVITAIDTLVAEGILETKVGAGVFVAEAAVALNRVEIESHAATPPIHFSPDEPDVDELRNCRFDFRPCRPSLEAFPMQVWKRCVALAGSQQPSSDYGSPLGDEGLRAAICDYLRRSRGLIVTPAQMIITNGAVNAMHLAARLYLDTDAEVVVENPGYPLARQVFANAGARIIPVVVDDDGLRVDLLPQRAEKVRIVCVTPSHQFPVGGRLSLSRRMDLIEWARRNDVLIVEDDYDGEFRYDVPPLSPLAALGGSQVLYVGTFSKTMFPGLRIGFAVGTEQLIEAMGRLRSFSEYAPNAIIQSALLRFVDGSHYERHILRMRRIYREKRGALVASLVSAGQGYTISGIDSGLNAHVQLPEGMSAHQLSVDLAKRGILVPTIDRYAFDQKGSDSGLVVGFAAPSLQDINAIGGLLSSLGH
ncbi:PLP-dependent aminotransferase family protein [Erythrobacter sp. JK5]|uniref:MocR-like pyridoxine biosynthesis transcription factor PdxR n=1 Tax=Erythrobacter sp. JK5 TaxID=2829500 RepID=UPI001BABD920|nr:PLP-dependent aminotransferase family protein [Erythrobacter sp. JK5]QUL37634.1 PLP-dependent aminotransferase family protein [Erythrobacter sp. JK5]